MKEKMKMCSTKKARCKSVRSSRGVALVFTLLLLTLLMALSLGMSIAIGSQTFIAGYYRNFRGAFYAADSGSNIARTALYNQLVAAVPSNFTNGTSPISVNAASTILSNVTSAYTNWTTIDSGSAASSWPESFKVSSATFTQASCTVSGTGGTAPFTCTNLPTSATQFQYIYSYSVTALGEVKSNEQSSVTDSGNFVLTINVTAATPQVTSFAAWGMFIGNQSVAECGNGTLVGGEITGPVFSNSGFTFDSSSNYQFTGTVGMVDSGPGFQYEGINPNNASGFATTGTNESSPDNNNSACDANVATPATSPWTTAYTYSTGSGSSKKQYSVAQNISYQSAPSYSQNVVPLPTNDFSQQWAVLDGLGVGEGSAAPTAAQMDTYGLRNSSGLFPTTGTTTGVYLAYSTSPVGSCTVAPCMTGGGIYVSGSTSNVRLTASTGSAPGNHPLQSFSIVQGSSTTIVTEDLTANTTTVTWPNSTSTTINGLPMNNNNSSPATMLYVAGSIGSNSSNTGLSGPENSSSNASTGAAIQNNAAVTVVASGNIDVVGDITYATEPVTTSPNQTVSYATTTCCPNTPNSDYGIPLPANASTQVLGIYTGGGYVYLDNQQSNGNLEIDAAIATISATGSWAIEAASGSNTISKLTIVGGRIQNTIQNIGANQRNVWFDTRFLQNGFAPPWFPSTTVTPAGVSGTSLTATIARLTWVNNNATLN